MYSSFPIELWWRNKPCSETFTLLKIKIDRNKDRNDLYPTIGTSSVGRINYKVKSLLHVKIEITSSEFVHAAKSRETHDSAFWKFATFIIPLFCTVKLQLERSASEDHGNSLRTISTLYFPFIFSISLEYFDKHSIAQYFTYLLSLRWAFVETKLWR